MLEDMDVRHVQAVLIHPVRGMSTTLIILENAVEALAIADHTLTRDLIRM